MSFYAEFTKKNSFLSFQSPIFHSKIHKRRGTFFERRVTHEKERTLRGEVHVKQTGTNNWGRGQKLEISSERTF